MLGFRVLGLVGYSWVLGLNNLEKAVSQRQDRECLGLPKP